MNESCFLQISRLCAEEAAAQEQTGQVEECLKVNLLKIKQEACKKVKAGDVSVFKTFSNHTPDILLNLFDLSLLNTSRKYVDADII